HPSDTGTGCQVWCKAAFISEGSDDSNSRNEDVPELSEVTLNCSPNPSSIIIHSSELLYLFAPLSTHSLLQEESILLPLFFSPPTFYP
ncbi:hypothetical protein JOQ06_011634, partial [Pogonophryne albipinna]